MSEGLSQRLREVRLWAGLTASKMADSVGLKDRKSWERYERGETVPNAEVLARLADQDFDVNWIITGKGAMRQGLPESSVPPRVNIPAPIPTEFEYDEEVLEQVARAISEVYREENARIQPMQLVQMAATWYGDLMRHFAPGEFDIALKGMLVGLRRELRSPQTPGSTSGKLLA